MAKSIKRFFGLKKQDVVQFLNDLERTFGQELEELEDKISEMIEINEEIKEELAVLELKHQSEKDNETLTHALDHLPKLFELIDAHFKSEVRSYHEDSNAELIELETKYHKLTNEISNGQKLLEGVISQYSNAIENLSSQNLEKDVEITEQDEQQFIDSIKGIDPSTVKSYKESDFWGDMSHYTTPEVRPQPRDIPKVAPSQKEEGVPKDTDTDNNNDFFETDVTYHEKEVNDRKLTDSKPKQEIGNDLEEIRQRYMIGKLSGIDLYDSNGNKICSVNEVITPEIVEKANQFGFLPELIVNMKMSGIGD